MLIMVFKIFIFAIILPLLYIVVTAIRYRFTPITIVDKYEEDGDYYLKLHQIKVDSIVKVSENVYHLNEVGDYFKKDVDIVKG